jgi:LPXTG-site transpeptidase (sortase) family protein
MTETPAPPTQSSPDRGRRRRIRLAAVLVIGLCAIAPWLVPWPWQSTDASSNTPSSVVEQPSPAGSADPVRQGPTDQTVKDLVREVSETASGGYDLPVKASEVSGVRTTPGAYQQLGRLQIPRVGLDVSFGEGVFAKTLDKGPGHWPGTPMPGQPGNAVVSGHRNTHTQPFKQLDVLRPGDQIIASVGDRKSVTYRVVDTTIVPEAKYRDFVLRQPKDPKDRSITLFACHPEGNPIFRIVVRATANG